MTISGPRRSKQQTCFCPLCCSTKLHTFLRSPPMHPKKMTTTRAKICRRFGERKNVSPAAACVTKPIALLRQALGDKLVPSYCLKNVSLRVDLTFCRPKDVALKSRQEGSLMPSINVTNASFEDQDMNDGKSTYGGAGSEAIQDWVLTGGSGGVYDPSGSYLNNVTGSDIGYLYDEGAAVSQQLSQSYDANEKYDFSVDIGNPGYAKDLQDYTINIYAGSTLIGTRSGTTDNTDTLRTETVTSTVFNPGLDGQPIRIEIVKTGQDNEELHFDNVQVNYTVLDGTVTGTAGDDIINIDYTDLDGDIVDGSDGVDDIINAGRGNDTVIAGFGDDTVYGGNGRDDLYGGDSATIIGAPISWRDVPDPDNGGQIEPGDDIGTTSVSSGGVTIGLAFGENMAEFDSGPQQVSGIDTRETTIDSNSHISINNTGIGNINFSNPVKNISFRVNDFEGELETLKVTVRDSGDNPISYNVTLGSNVNGTDTDGDSRDDTFNGVNGSSANDTSLSGSILFDIPGPASSIEFNFTESGGSLTITDIFFDDQSTGGSGGDDLLQGGRGSDIIDGGDGNDTIYGGGQNDLLLGSTGSDTLDGGNGNDTLSYRDEDGARTISEEVITVSVNDSGDGSVVKNVSGGTDTTDRIEIFIADEGQSGPNIDEITMEDTVTDRSSIAGLDDNSVGSFTPTNGDPQINFGGAGQPTLSELLALNNAGTISITSGDETGAIGDVSFENFETINFDVVCFAGGTHIMTIEGEVLIEDISIGDMVLTMDNGYQPVRWIGSRKLDKIDFIINPKLRPIRIMAGALGQGMPKTDLTVSPQHRVLVRSVIAERMFDTREVLIPAIKLVELDGVYQDEECTVIQYFHMLFDAHEIIFSNGAATESLFTGPEAIKSLSDEAVEEITTLFPEITAPNYAPSAVRYIPAKGKLMKQLVSRHLKNCKVLMSGFEPPMFASS